MLKGKLKAQLHASAAATRTATAALGAESGKVV
jgi:hypothetical protein